MDDEDLWPIRFDVGRVGLGFGVGCGVGIGVGKPLRLGGIPVVGDAMNGISTGLGQLPLVSSIGYHLSRGVQHVGIPHFGAGLGCGVGIGYGYGAGWMLKENALKKTQLSIQHTLRRHQWLNGGRVADNALQGGNPSIASKMAHQTQEIEDLRQQCSQMKEAFCRVHPEEPFCKGPPSDEDTASVT